MAKKYSISRDLFDSQDGTMPLGDDYSNEFNFGMPGSPGYSGAMSVAVVESYQIQHFPIMAGTPAGAPVTPAVVQPAIVDQPAVNVAAVSISCDVVTIRTDMAWTGNDLNSVLSEPQSATTLGGKWGSSGVFGTAGGTVTWSITGAGLADQTGQSFFLGSTVSLASFLPSDYVSQITAAFAQWSQVANINFVQVTDGGGNFGVGTTANIRVGGGYIDGYSTSGSIVGQAFGPPVGGSAYTIATNGDLIFDSGDAGHWDDSLLYATALHEIGHTLGLGHVPQDSPTAVMNPFLHIGLPLQADDIAGIRYIYGSHNTAPVATIADHSLHTGEWASIAGWTSYSDANGDSATYYQLYDGGAAASSAKFWTPSSGYQPTLNAITVSAAEFGQVQVGGAAAGGSETMWIRAFDGTDWSAWDSFGLTTLPNTPPVATIADHSLHTNEWANVAGWTSYSDVNGNSPTQYQLYDGGAAASSAKFWTPSSGYQPALNPITLSAAEFVQTQVGGGTTGQIETMSIRAFDGTDWSAWDAFTFTTLPNSPPVATISDHSLHTNQWAGLASWTSYSDADGNSATQYQIYDGSAAASSAKFWTPSSGYQPALNPITVSAAEFSQTQVGGGTAAGSETMSIRAFDGTDWSAWDSFNFTTLPNTAPVVSVADHSLHTDQWANVSGWTSYSDADGDTATQYQFYDGGAAASSAKFWTPSSGYQPALNPITVSAAEFAQVQVGGATANGSEAISIRGFDGTDWSAWHPFTLLIA